MFLPSSNPRGWRGGHLGAGQRKRRKGQEHISGVVAQERPCSGVPSGCPQFDPWSWCPQHPADTEPLDPAGEYSSVYHVNRYIHNLFSVIFHNFKKFLKIGLDPENFGNFRAMSRKVKPREAPVSCSAEQIIQ